MGSSQSIDASCPWLHSSGLKFNVLFETKILNISLNNNNFLYPHETLKEERSNEFNIEKYTDVISHAMNYDKKLTQIFALLVPKKISENNFWCNYLSHIEHLLNSATDNDVIREDKISTSNIPGDGTKAVTTKSNVEIIKVIPVSNLTENKIVLEDIEMLKTPSPVIPAVINSKSNSNIELVKDIVEVSAIESKPVLLSNSIVINNNYFFSKYLLNINSEYLIPVKIIKCNKVRIGFYGVNDINLYDHNSCINYNLNDGLEKFAVFRRDEDVGKRVAVKFNIKKSFTSFELFVNSVDLIIFENGSLDIESLTHFINKINNKKYIFCPPFGRHYEESKLAVDIMRARNIKYTFGSPFKYSTKLRLLKELITLASPVSVISYIYSTVKMPDLIVSNSGGGYFNSIGAHFFDIFAFLFNSLSHLQSNASKIDENCKHEQNVGFTFRTSDCLGSALFNFNSVFIKDELTVMGANGCFRCSLYGDDLPKFDNGTCSFAFNFQQPLSTASDGWNNLLSIFSTKELFEDENSSLDSVIYTDSVLRNYYRDRSDQFWTRPETWSK